MAFLNCKKMIEELNISDDLKLYEAGQIELSTILCIYSEQIDLFLKNDKLKHENLIEECIIKFKVSRNRKL